MRGTPPAEIGGWIFEQKVAVQVRRELAQVACFFKDPSLEAVRKGRWRSKLGVGGAIGLGIERTQDESPAEGAVAFSTCLWGWIGSMLCPLHFGGFFLDLPFQQAKAVAENCSDVAAFPPLRSLRESSPSGLWAPPRLARSARLRFRTAAHYLQCNTENECGGTVQLSASPCAGIGKSRALGTT